MKFFDKLTKSSKSERTESGEAPMTQNPNTPPSGISEVTARFLELVMMHAQQAMMFLGKIPNPQTGYAEVNPEVAKIFIDQLEALEIKTRGNLSREEDENLKKVLNALRMAFIEVAGVGARESLTEKYPETGAISRPESAPTAPSSKATAEPSTPARPAPTPPPSDAAPSSSAENKKKFVKSYG